MHADARVIAATNRDLRRMDAEGAFRADLFYRLGGFHIALPPLRERAEDIPELAAAFVEKIALQQHREGAPPGLTPEALAGAAALPLAGERPRAAQRHRARGAALRGEHRSGAPAAGDHAERRKRRRGRKRDRGGSRTGNRAERCNDRAAPTGATLKDAREHDHAATERRLLVEALERFRGNKRAVARHLEIDPKTLYRLLKKHGIFISEPGAS